MLLTISSIFIVIAIVLGFKLLNKNDEPPIFGVYSQKYRFYWIKYGFMICVLYLKEVKPKIMKKIEKWRNEESSSNKRREYEASLEKPQSLGDSTLAADAIFFNVASPDGEVVLFNIARRQNGVCDAFFFVKIKDKELLLTPSWPDTYLQHSDDEQGLFKVAGIEAECTDPMKSWTFKYNGVMKTKSDQNKEYNVKAALTWTSDFCYFHFNNMAPSALANSIASEPWSSDYFDFLNSHHQDHYEQMGSVSGTINIDGEEYKLNNLPSMRDHTITKNRNWRNFHRYVYHFIYLENGDRVAIGTISQYHVLSHITVGYFCRASDKRVFPINWSSFKLYEHGESQIRPKDYAFRFTADKQTYTVQVLLDFEEMFYIGNSREAQFYERWSTFYMNGIKGCGCVEWHYNNVHKNIRQ